ncbi:MAG TPA: DNA gyrase inhibitor YacG [Acidobacteriaceae bacterium]|nr:DNA gyrase inhibitor YacG [Acidobacteriaceae bacterium]
MSPKSTILRCPTCRAVVTQKDEEFPFCSDRCRVIDLGKWASGAYRISSPVLDPEVLEGLGGEGQPHGKYDEED